MPFCAGCGSPNLDSDATCRVCGRSLTGDPTPPPMSSAAQPADHISATAEHAPNPSPTATAVADAPAAPSCWPRQTGALAKPDRSAPTVSVTLPSTGVATPSGFESVPAPYHQPNARPADDLPSFLRPAARAATVAASNESTSLISEHDLPDWIRQIAADDARKLAEAQVQEATGVGAVGSSMPSHFGRRVLPGETLTSGPALSSWLSRKDAVAGAAESAWDVTGAPPPSRSVTVPHAMPAQAAIPSEAMPMVTDVVVAETVSAPSWRRRRGSAEEKSVGTLRKAHPTPPQGAARGNPTRVYLLAAIVVALLIAVALITL